MSYKQEICDECRFYEPGDGRCLARKLDAWRGDTPACYRFRLCELSRRERGLAPLETLRRCKRYAMRLVPALPGFELHVKHAAKGGAQ